MLPADRALNATYALVVEGAGSEDRAAFDADLEAAGAPLAHDDNQAAKYQLAMLSGGEIGT